MNTIQMTPATTPSRVRDTGAEQLPAPIRNRLAQQGLVSPAGTKPAPAGTPPRR